MSDHLKQQALKFIQSIDQNRTEAADVDWSAPEDTLIHQAAAATRKSILLMPVPDIRGQQIPLRIARKGETPEQLVERCLGNWWRSVGHDFHFPEGLSYTTSPDPALNSRGVEFGEWTWQINRHPEWTIAARLYHYDPRPEYASAVSGWLRSWLEQCPMPEEDLNAHQGPWRTIEIGIRMGSQWPKALSAFCNAPEFDDILFLAWMQSYAEQAEFVWKYRKRNNWLLMEMNGLMHAGVQVNIHKDADRWRKDATDEFIRQTGIQFHPDGFQRELSTSYHKCCLSNYRMAAAALEAGCHTVPSELELLMKSLLRPFRAMVRPNGNCFDFQDSHCVNLQETLRTLPESWIEDFDHFFLGDSQTPPETRCHVLENAGYAVLRSGYGEDDVAVAFDGGPLGDAHQHEDKLSIQIHAGGIDLIGEAGIVDYSDTPERRYCLTSLAHSTALVDDKGQNRREDYTPDKTENDASAGLEYDLECDSPWVKASYTEGYGTTDNCSVIHTRKVILISKSHIRICDEFEPTDGKPHRIEILYHCLRDEAVLEGNSFHSQGTGPNVTLRWSSDSEAIAAEVTTGGTAPDLRGWAAPEKDTLGYWAVVQKPCLTLSFSCHEKTAVMTDVFVIYE